MKSTSAKILREWVQHYNSGRPHSSLSPGIPDEAHKGTGQNGRTRQTMRERAPVIARPVLGGLHHEYVWEEVAAA